MAGRQEQGTGGRCPDEEAAGSTRLPLRGGGGRPRAHGRFSEAAATASSTATTPGTRPSARRRQSALVGAGTARADGTRSTRATGTART
jgi:hypothetical protein